jgi:hypothetical protein
MSATVVPAATVLVDTPRRDADAAQIVADEFVAATLRGAVAALVAACRNDPRSTQS